MDIQAPCFSPTGVWWNDVFGIVGLAITAGANVALNVIAVWKIVALQNDVHNTKKLVQRRRAELDKENGKHE